jgi:hypothetical protein
MGLFDGGMTQAHRERHVIDMLGHAPREYESEVMRHFAADLLNKAESQAMRWLQNEIAECQRGESARHILKKSNR